jgi:hypothetical protein
VGAVVSAPVDVSARLNELAKEAAELRVRLGRIDTEFARLLRQENRESFEQMMQKLVKS